MSKRLIDHDFLTPKRKRRNVIGNKNVEEYTSYEFYEASDQTKEIKHYIAEAERNKVKKININSRNKHQISSVPEWALLAVTTISRRSNTIRDSFQTWY